MKKLIFTLALITSLTFNLKAQEAGKSAVKKDSIVSKPTITTAKNEYGGATGGVVNIQNQTNYFSKKGYDSYKAHSDMGSATKTENPDNKPNTTTKEVTKPAPKESSTIQRRRVEVLKSNKTGDPNAKNN